MRSGQQTRREIDAIFTFSGAGNGLCCMAVQYGFGYGFNSSSYKLCCAQGTMPGHRVLFIDNDYQHYDHAKHLEVVALFRPKYATALDIERSGQVDRVLQQAEELAQYAERIIVIPKIDCLAEIPERFVLGYSVPTSYGATDLDITVFGKRPVHLLGGSWRQQRALLREMNVVSLDFNHAHKIARSGLYTDLNGYEYRLRDTLPGFNHRPYVMSMMLSFAAIRSGIDHATNHARSNGR